MKIIDISYAQTSIDWDYVKSEGIEGVIIKMADGVDLDDNFGRYVNGATAAGLPYGVYLYGYAQDKERAQREAETAISIIKEYLNGQCPELGIWYDIEESMLDGDP